MNRDTRRWPILPSRPLTPIRISRGLMCMFLGLALSITPTILPLVINAMDEGKMKVVVSLTAGLMFFGSCFLLAGFVQIVLGCIDHARGPIDPEAY